MGFGRGARGDPEEASPVRRMEMSSIKASKVSAIDLRRTPPQSLYLKKLEKAEVIAQRVDNSMRFLASPTASAAATENARRARARIAERNARKNGEFTPPGDVAKGDFLERLTMAEQADKQRLQQLEEAQPTG